ncbi:hypothetical protein [Gilvimarinus sp. DA14]|uniref:DUF7010 family protein n=1 Tax=Gilvimarinus sp. DA14 TaxID=2956798 RepID=UPI0020B7A730|nr:hypothetical protein [Gilvimarinus sp. DA14]UTF61826.1 hypothetical protein NHM04_08550 [Gilvimarinus sp. DA14]
MNTVEDYQKDMNTGYYYGVPGVIASGSVWLLAGIVAFVHSANIGIATLVLGGTLIFPLSVLLCKALGRSGKHQPGNPLAPLAIEGTLWMLFSIPIAIGAAFYRPEWFFPAMMFVIGGRYLTFNTLYGNRVFWLFGVVLFAAGWLLLALQAPVYAGGIAGGAIELVFALLILLKAKAPAA